MNSGLILEPVLQDPKGFAIVFNEDLLQHINKNFDPSSKLSVLLFRFAVVTPILLFLGAVTFSKVAAQFCQILVVIIVAITFSALIRVVYLYDDFGLLVNQWSFLKRCLVATFHMKL